jgi:hypothetical protein
MFQIGHEYTALGLSVDAVKGRRGNSIETYNLSLYNYTRRAGSADGILGVE